jgi:TIR domain
MIDENKINVFISYSWDSEEHKMWVQALAKSINEANGNSIVDQKLKFGSHLRLFMEVNIKSSDIVLLVLSPNYKNKAQMLNGGVGYEYNIITKELFKVLGTNEKYIGVLREGDHNSSVPDFIEDFKYVDLREGHTYDENLKELLEQILKTPMKQPLINNIKMAEKEKEYCPINDLIVEMSSKAWKYFEQMFVLENNNLTKENLKSKKENWEKEIEIYHSTFEGKFKPSKMEIYEGYLEDFKNNIFGKELWTVKSALKTHDPDLARYKRDYGDANAGDLYNTINGILTETHEYVRTNKIDYLTIKEIAELHLDYLNEEEMFMKKIVGFGIRSEILHRYYPANFSIMTQKSLWAMYFICDSANEFITIEHQNRNGIMRVSHNWQYPYDRFTFLMNALANQFILWLSKYDIAIKPQYRFGYINMFLSSINDIHKADIKLLHEWVEF